MGNVHVKFLSSLAGIAAENEVDLEQEGETTIKGVLDALREKLGGEYEEKIYSSETGLNKYVMILLNGEDTRSLDGINTGVKPGDELVFIPLIAGG